MHHARRVTRSTRRTRSGRSDRPIAVAVWAILAATTLAACGPSVPPVLVPPRVELAPHSRLGLVTFTVENAEGKLSTFATERFAHLLFAAQTGFELLELGQQPQRVDAVSARELGAAHGVATILVGHIVVSDVKPRASLIGGFHVAAEANIAMTARLLSAETGGILWTQTAQLREDIGGVSLTNGHAVFDAPDPDEAYGAMVDRLLYDVTRDFRATWVRQ